MKRSSKTLTRTGADLVRDLTAARNDAASATATVALIARDARYWDCVHGHVDGRERIASLLRDPLIGRGDAEVDVKTLASEEDVAIVELRVVGVGELHGIEFVRTEVYGLATDGMAWCRAYFDPAELSASDEEGER